MQSSKQPIPTQPLDSSLKKPPPSSKLPENTQKAYQRALQGLESDYQVEPYPMRC